MPYCPTHGLQQGKHCPECGTPLSDSPPSAGDSVRVRSPEAHAHASANPTFVFPGGHMETRPALVKCPKCGKRNLEPATFDCKGDCGRENLCERHFDEEYQVCVDCAREFRGEAKAEAERRTQLQADLVSWRQRAEQAEARVDELTRQGEQAQRALELAQAELHQAQQRVRSLEQELTGQRRAGEQSGGQVLIQMQKELERGRTELLQAQESVRWLERELAIQRRRTEQAEAGETTIRDEVAGELAVITSTMLRLKEQQLKEAHRELQRLQKELDDLRQEKA